MKPNQKKLLFAKSEYFHFITAIFLVLILQQCNCKKHSAIKFKVAVNAIHGIAFLDLTDGTPANVRNVKVTLIDPGNMVLSSNGFEFKSTDLPAGVMSIGLSPKAQFNTERPYRFTIRAEAAGYMTNIRSIVITDSTPDYIPIYMAKLDNKKLPSGLAASVGNLNIANGGVITRDEQLTAILPKGKGDSIKIRIQRGTRLFYDDTAIQSKDSLSFRLLFAMAGDSNANRVFPGGFEVTDAFDKNSKQIASAANPVFFTTAGWFSMEMNVGKQVVNRFSNPLEVEMSISDSVLNPVTGQHLKAGDKVPIWSLDRRTGTWLLESETEVIVSASGKLKANITINHLSVFNLDFQGPKCISPLTITFTPGEFNGTFFSEYIRVSDNAVLKAGLLNFNFPPPGSLSLLKVPDGSSAGRLFVHDGGDQTFPARGISSIVSCNGPTSGTLTRFNNSPGTCITIQFFKDDNGTVTALCTNNVWLEPNGGSGQFLIMTGVLNTGSVNIPFTTGNQTIQLYYMRTGVSVMLTISLNVDIAAGNTAEAQVFIAGISYSGVMYSGDSSGPCGRTIQVKIPKSVIDAAQITCF